MRRYVPIAALIALFANTACVVTVPALPRNGQDGSLPVIVAGTGIKNPVLQSFTANPTNVTTGQAMTFQVVAFDPSNEVLQFNWSATDGTLSANTGRVVSWTPPTKPGVYTVSVVITNSRGGIVTGSQNLTVTTEGTTTVSGQPTIAPPVTVASPTPQASASVTADVSPSPAISPSVSPSQAPGTMPSASVAPSPSPTPSPVAGDHLGTITTIPGTKMTLGWGMGAGSNTVYLPHDNSLQCVTFNSLTDFKVTLEPQSTKLRAIGDSPHSATVDGTKHYYFGYVDLIKPDGSALPLQSGIRYNQFVVVGDYAYITSQNHCIYKMNIQTGQTSILAGQETAGFVDGQGTAAQFDSPFAITYDPLTNALYVTDNKPLWSIRKVTFDGQVTTVFSRPVDDFYAGGKPANVFGLTTDGAGNFYICDVTTNAIYHVTLDGTLTRIAGNGKSAVVDGVGSAASFYSPHGIAYGKIGDKPVLYVVEFFGALRVVTDW